MSKCQTTEVKDIIAALRLIIEDLLEILTPNREVEPK